MTRIKIITLELIITLISVIGLITSLTSDTDTTVKIIVSAGLLLSILYGIFNLIDKMKDHAEKEKTRKKLMNKFIKNSESILYYISLVLINHEEPYNTHSKDEETFLQDQAILKFFEVDFRNEDPYTGTSIGNLAEQVSSGLQKLKQETDILLSQYLGYIGITPEIELMESVFSNDVFYFLMSIDSTYNQLSHIYSQVNNPSIPKTGIPITITIAYDEYKHVYINLIKTLFKIKNSA